MRNDGAGTMFVSDMVEHCGTMCAWFNEPGAKLFFEYLSRRKEHLLKQLLEEHDMFVIYRLQGELATTMKILTLPSVVLEANKNKGA